VGFDGSTNGSKPYGKLLQGTDGALYGTAQSGGTGGKGVVYRMTELPFITSEPAGQTIQPGVPVTLSLSAAGGFGPLSYQWFLNGTNIGGATGTNFTTTNQGTYSVVVSNSFGTITSSNAMLTFPQSSLTLQIVGQGSVTPNLNGESLVVGNTYTISATPAPGWALAYWSGDVSGNEAGLTFVMQSNLVIHANFVPTSFVPAKGNYTGLFSPVNGASPQNSGALTLTINSRGKFTAKARFASGQASFVGQLTNAHATATGHLVGNKNESLILALEADITPGTARMAGTLKNGSFTALVSAALAGISPVAPPFGQKLYTMAMPPGTNAASTPGGWSALTARLGTQGNLALKGTLGDGLKTAQSALTSTNGDLPLFVPFNRGQGMLLGWVQLAGDSPAGANILWMKSSGQQQKQSYYPNGFSLSVPLIGSLYIPPASGGSSLSLSNGIVVLSGGNLPAPPFTNSFSLIKRRFSFPSNPNGMALSVNSSSGTFSGSFTSPSTGRKTALNGIVLQELNMAVGLFPGSDQTGQVLLQGR
jgi:hypothetical protein